MIGEFFKIGASPTTGIEVETFGMHIHLAAGLLEFCLEIVAERIVD
jgi:hypothetical protein